MPPVSAKIIEQRISDFQELVNKNQDFIRKEGDKSWNRISKGSEVHRVHEFLRQKDAGNHYLNDTVGKKLRQNGWVVKFAGIFLHQKPMVRGILPGSHGMLPRKCELGDLQSIFAHVGAKKAPAKTRSVIYQAKTERASGQYHVKHPFQRQLYDDCEGFRYETSVSGVRNLPRGADRARALQYLFVNESPVSTKTIPALAAKGAFAGYGEHLLRFLNNSTGLGFDTGDAGNDWGGIVNDMMGLFSGANPNGRYTRESGLADIINPFNSFESDDVVFLGPEVPPAPERGEQFPTGDYLPGYGVQIIIVWDEEMRGDLPDLPLLPPPPLEEFQRLSDYYDTAHFTDLNERNMRRDKLAEEMATVGLSVEGMFDEALRTSGNGSVAGLAMSLLRSPSSIGAEWIMSLLPKISWNHTLELALKALQACIRYCGWSHAAGNLRELVKHELLHGNYGIHFQRMVDEILELNPMQQQFREQHKEIRIMEM